MWGRSEICPDCGTRLTAQTGPAPCETCWRVVPVSVRGVDNQVVPTGRWTRLPPQLQRVQGIVCALRGAVGVWSTFTPEDS